MKKVKLTREDHEKLGDAIKSIRISLMLLGGITAKCYGKNSDVASEIQKATKKISKAKMLLGKKCFIESGCVEGGELPYYGDAEATEEIKKLHDEILQRSEL